jgi:hypothetical protein
MPDDIVDRLRSGWHHKDTSGRVAHEAADEIERLRHELRTLQTWRNDDIDTFHHQAMKAMYLQAKIDAYAAANAEYGEPQQFLDAKHALLAVATPKEDDR